MTYTSRPPATARAARRAWDYFSAKYPSRTIGALTYTPNYCGDFRGWIVDWEFDAATIDRAMEHWGAMYSTDWMHSAASSAEINRALAQE